MASSVDIANSALTKIGDKRITALSENTKPAREINAIYELRRRALLRKYNWNFAMKRDSLVALSDAPSWGYAVQYQLPSDCLRMVQVNDYYMIPSIADYLAGADTELFTIENGKILTDWAAPLKVRYVRNVTNSGEFDDSFVEAFACDLAYQVAEALTESATKKEQAKEMLSEALKDAMRNNAIEKPPQNMQDDAWVISRI